jgi:hypothetical protein
LEFPCQHTFYYNSSFTSNPLFGRHYFGFCRISSWCERSKQCSPAHNLLNVYVGPISECQEGEDVSISKGMSEWVNPGAIHIGLNT